jgi:serine/threonine-protein kinase SRPK3
MDHQEWTEGTNQSYHIGGVHPVQLGDIYNSKYMVLRKLGQGGYSTVWLIRNQE